MSSLLRSLVRRDEGSAPCSGLNDQRAGRQPAHDPVAHGECRLIGLLAERELADQGAPLGDPVRKAFLLTESKFARSCALVYMFNFNWLDLIRNRLGTEMVLLGFLVSTFSSSSSLQSASDLGTSTNRSKTDLEIWMGW